ncbi:MAG: DnaB-like helicase C-terminal domain-containing protein [Candidatus Marinimicrobia bacterium]|nr:DnaB-like helicase C-terminal domain-containing protein [Candidatus Neomarinimicrobiota bacterium]
MNLTNLHDEPTERALLGKLINDPESLARIDGLSVDDFYSDFGKIIFSAIQNLTKNGKSADLLAVSNYLKSSGDLQKIGGDFFLTGLGEYFVSSGLIAQDAERLIDLANRRRVYFALTSGVQNLETGSGLPEVTESVLSALQETEHKDGGSFRPISEATDRLIDELDVVMAGKSTVIPTGFYDLDALIEGLRPSDVIIIGARTSAGKTLFALNVALHVLKSGFPVGLISLEMSKNQIARRLICASEKIDVSKIRPRRIDDDTYKRYLHGIEKLQALPLFIQDLSSGRAFQILTQVEYLVKMRGIRLLIFDHLQLMNSGKSETRNLELGEISRAIKLFALKNQIPVMVLSQMNRKSGDSGMPNLSELRDSGAIEQDADIVLLLNRVSEATTNGMKDFLQVKVGKNRHGQTGEITLNVFLDQQRLENFTTQMESQF